jgi:DNA-binding response OmpR family regulator
MTSDQTTDGAALLVAEDDDDVRETTGLVLERRGFRVRLARDGVEALELCQAEAPDLAVVDIAMPRMDGLALTRRLRELGIPVVLLSARSLPSDVVGGLDLGADDYVTKPFDPDILTARIRTVLRRSTERTTDEMVAVETFGDFIFDRGAMAVFRFDERVSLSPTELKLLTVLLDNRGRVLSRDQIVEAVWGDQGWDYGRVVDTNVQRLRRKLDPVGIETVRGIGYRMDRA